MIAMLTWRGSSVPHAHQRVADLAGGLLDLGGARSRRCGCVGEELGEGRAAVGLGGRGNRCRRRTPAVGVRNMVSGQPPCWPSAWKRGLVGEIDLRAFLAVDLDADEMRVHHLGGRRVGEGLLRHHMATSGRRCSRSSRIGFVERLGLGQRLGLQGRQWTGLSLQERVGLVAFAEQGCGAEVRSCSECVRFGRRWKASWLRPPEGG